MTTPKTRSKDSSLRRTEREYRTWLTLAQPSASAVIFLCATESQIPIGTAFIVGYPVPEVESRYVPLVVTAKHVIGDHAEVYGRYTPLDGRKPVTVEYDLAAFRKSGDLWNTPTQGSILSSFDHRPSTKPSTSQFRWT